MKGLLFPSTDFSCLKAFFFVAVVFSFLPADFLMKSIFALRNLFSGLCPVLFGRVAGVWQRAKPPSHPNLAKPKSPQRPRPPARGPPAPTQRPHRKTEVRGVHRKAFCGLFWSPWKALKRMVRPSLCFYLIVSVPKLPVSWRLNSAISKHVHLSLYS